MTIKYNLVSLRHTQQGSSITNAVSGGDDGDYF